MKKDSLREAISSWANQAKLFELFHEFETENLLPTDPVPRSSFFSFLDLPCFSPPLEAEAKRSRSFIESLAAMQRHLGGTIIKKDLRREVVEHLERPSL